MNGSRTLERQKTFERLAGAVSLRGWKDFEVSLESGELRIEKGRSAACTVVMLPDEPVFQAHFVFATTSVLAVSFTIGEPVSQTGPAATKSFHDIDEAALWLLEFLETDHA